MPTQNFSATNTSDGQLIAVTTASQTVQIARNSFEKNATELMLDNRGGVDCYVRAGDASTVATALCVRVPAGSIMTVGKGSATHLAVIGDGATNLWVLAGSGI